jgi:hypothetical protein
MIRYPNNSEGSPEGYWGGLSGGNIRDCKGPVGNSPSGPFVARGCYFFVKVNPMPVVRMTSLLLVSGGGLVT